jgi:hypothetical protein
MISPANFAKGYGSFWNTIFPMADALIRAINLDYERFAPDADKGFYSDPKRRAIINETAFELARMRWPNAEADLTLMDSAFAISAETMLRIDPSSNIEYPSDTEWHEVEFVVGRLMQFFRSQSLGTALVFSPPVPGCGFVDGGRADILVDSVVFEVKSGERNFRAIDLRQVLTYAALMNMASPNRISSVALLNPRRGVYYRADCDDICAAAGGAPSAYCFSQMVGFMSGTFNSI